MLLKELSYREFENKKNSWTLAPFTLGQLNLLVGKNASGKTRTLNAIASLSNLISSGDKLQYLSGDYTMRFEDDSSQIAYSLGYEDAAVMRESFIIDGNILLDRGPGGNGTIFAKEVGKRISFQAPTNELAVVSRRDNIQHPFFEKLYEWSKWTCHYLFGDRLGKDRVAGFVKVDSPVSPNPKDTNQVVFFLKFGLRTYGDDFLRRIIGDMSDIGYDLEEVGVAPVGNMIVLANIAPPPESIYVIERGLGFPIFQHEMSQGMFRALSLMIQLNLLQSLNTQSCILIDDIGEGLDFERSKALIQHILLQAQGSNGQIIMSTNDRFVMNHVPLEYWNVIQRKGSVCEILNYSNSKDRFEEFKFTGLSNFDFFSTDYLGRAVES
jgi:energy-coupling factor transporter ATP-binding protein EcfA2